VLFEPYAQDLVARLASRSPARVLELACGTGTDPEASVAS
jgi:ubiquinone/menaquinone biosynthesis C-methylase UbiE